MSRILLVDDSNSARMRLGAILREAGYEVVEAQDAETAAEKALSSPPDAVVSDLIMPTMSGVQLCRFLKSEPSTSHVPVVLLTASGDRKSRYWARSAGAAGYVSKTELEKLHLVLPELIEAARSESISPPRQGPVTRAVVHERLSELLDGALFESVIAGEVRALASAGEMTRIFSGLCALATDVLTYRWLALLPEDRNAPFMLHAHPTWKAEASREASEALGVEVGRASSEELDDRAMACEGPKALVAPIYFGHSCLGQVALGPNPRGVSREDKKLFSLMAHELGGALQMASLVQDARRLAATDALTGLPNRRAFLENVERERSRSTRFSLPVSLLLLDIDHFKQVNDKLGHATGDAVLQGVARVLPLIARTSDYVARWGGEEFVLALPQTSEAGARVAAERLRRAVAEAKHPTPDGGLISVTASIGVASANAPWTIDEVIAAADDAMYAAKARGRNRVEAATKDGQTTFGQSQKRHELKSPTSQDPR